MPKNYLNYNPQKLERKWRRFWEKKKTFQVDLKKAKKPYYNLMMFPYPSAEGLHVGNVYAFTGSDIHGRFRRMQGYDVFEPIGFDAFGIHSENFALQKKIHPKVLIKKNIAHFRQQLKNLGCLFDWRTEVDTTNPNYYKWTQWLFLQLFKAGLAERKKAPVDWCPSCKTVLADEQVISGRCERCETEVIQKETEQWFFKITKYAERLLKNLKWIDWSERTKIAQKNWIGKSYGINVDFEIENSKEKISVFTTRIDTIFSGTFLILAPEHPLVEKITTLGQKAEVKKYILEAAKKNEMERTEIEKDKTGVFIGVYAINPASGEKMPIWIADFVLAGYGTGAVFADAHDQRDFDMAKKYDIPLKVSLRPKEDVLWEKVKNLEVCYPEEGILVNSAQFNGLTSSEAREKITVWLEKNESGKKAVNYHLRDWLISRQRYWGPPIPLVFCENCKRRVGNSQFPIPNSRLRREFNKGELENPGWIAMPEKDLPVLLPYVKDFRPTGKGESPLALVEKFVNTKCPKCGGPAKRETDVSDTFFDSSWYFLGYLSNLGDKKLKIKNKKYKLKIKNIPWDKKLLHKWLPVDTYIGGQEHAVLHLLYTRFITMALKDLGFIDFKGPFKKFRAHGLLTKGGAKMSKSKGNVVNPDEYYKKYGADTLRMYLMFLGPFEQGGDWQDRGIIGIKRFLEKVWKLKDKIQPRRPKGSGLRLKASENPKLETLIHKTIKKVTEDIENLRYNTAISALMILVNAMLKESQLSVISYQSLLKLLAPFAPYISEELWNNLGHKDSIHNQPWPKYDSKLVREETVILVVQVNGKVRDKIEVKKAITEKEARELVLNSPKIKKWLVGKEIKKVIFLPGKLINFVV